jgi:glycine cleavage system H protein
VVESTKAASDVYAPISGKVVAVNAALSKNPALINSASYTEGWIAKLEGISQAEIAGLLSVEDYRKLLGR